MPLINLPKPVAILCDVEGTTTSIRFWPSVLAPFIAETCRPCLEEWWSRPETQDVLVLLRERSFVEWRDMCDPSCPVILDPDNDRREAVIESAVSNIRYQISNRKHNDELKSLFLLVWLYGYEKDLLRSHVYGDVQQAFSKWNSNGIRIFTYASGSTLAQQMLFSRTLHGNLSHLIEYYFDSDTYGKKVHTKSFRLVAEKIAEPPTKMIFISDSLEELRPAKLAGFTPILVIRTHNQHLMQEEKLPFLVINSFADINFMGSFETN